MFLLHLLTRNPKELMDLRKRVHDLELVGAQHYRGI